jgi:mRNA interferase HigB
MSPTQLECRVQFGTCMRVTGVLQRRDRPGLPWRILRSMRVGPSRRQWSFLRPIWAHDMILTMRIIARRTLQEFVGRRRGSKDQRALKAALDAWFDEVRKARWTSTAEVKRRYATASIVSADRIVFNIKGNDYRLVVAVDFEKSIVWIKWIGAHKDYDKIDVKGVHYER